MSSIDKWQIFFGIFGGIGIYLLDLLVKYLQRRPSFKPHIITVVIIFVLLFSILIIPTYFSNPFFLFRTITGLKEKNVYYSYFADLDGKQQYISTDGEFQFRKYFIEKRPFVEGTVTGSYRTNGIWSKEKVKWETYGFMDRHYLHLSYDTGVAILINNKGDYIGYWIGEHPDSNVKALICPWVLSKTKIQMNNAEEARKNWDILNTPCRVCEDIKDIVIN